MHRMGLLGCGWLLGMILLGGMAARGEDWPMMGRTPCRNPVSVEKGAAVEWDVEAKKQIRWEAQLGSLSYGCPIVAGGLVFVGTNNATKRDAEHAEDGGVLMVFREKDGEFVYQRYSTKLESGQANDWPEQGICSTVLAEGDFAWYTTNRCEVVCLDVSPLRKGTGPAREVWVVDMIGKYGVFPHNMTSCSVAGYGDWIYVITGNGVDESHENIPAPHAPSILCLEKKTGKMVWCDKEPSEKVLHGQWASAAIAEVKGRALVIAPMGDGWVRAYDAKTGKVVWRFDANRKNTVYPETKNILIATPVIVGNRMYIGTGEDPEKANRQGDFWCVDITKEGDVSAEVEESEGKGKPNPNSAVVWHFQSEDLNGDGKIRRGEYFGQTISSAAVADGLVFIPDFLGFVHCFDAETGKRLWTKDLEAPIWGAALVIEGKVYVCDEEGGVTIFAAARECKVLGKRELGGAGYSSPVFANGTLYLMRKDGLVAVGEK